MSTDIGMINDFIQKEEEVKEEFEHIENYNPFLTAIVATKTTED